jgi:hypothetical protein
MPSRDGYVSANVRLLGVTARREAGRCGNARGADGDQHRVTRRTTAT